MTIWQQVREKERKKTCMSLIYICKEDDEEDDVKSVDTTKTFKQTYGHDDMTFYTRANSKNRSQAYSQIASNSPVC